MAERSESTLCESAYKSWRMNYKIYIDAGYDRCDEWLKGQTTRELEEKLDS